MKTFSQKPAEVERKWYVIDASSAPLGRVATKAASLLLGKGKPTVTSHVDGGDYVVIINADNLRVTGDKELKKVYYRHSGYPGGIYSRTMREQKVVNSASVIQKAVRGMLPDNKLRTARLARLKIYAAAEHAHMAQQPQEVVMKGND